MYEYQRREWEEQHDPLLQLERRRQKYMQELQENGCIPQQPQEPNYLALMTSISHTYGNVIAFIREWLLSQFPKNMFNTIHVNSKLAHRQLSTNKEFFKKRKPMLILRPRIADWSEDRFLKGTMITERKAAQYNTWGGTNLQEFIVDPAHDLQIKYQLNRSVMLIDIILIFETAMQQLDYMHFLVNQITPERPFSINANLESYIPLEMLDMVSKLSGVNIYDTDRSTKNFMSYIQGCSRYPITYKLQGSTGNREFFRYYNTNLDTVISDISHDDGNKVGQVTNNFQLTFTIRVEFMSTGYYYLFSPHLTEIDLPKIDPQEYPSSGIIPLFSDYISKDDLNMPIGWSIYNSAACMLEKENDTVEIGEMFNESIKKTIQYYRENGLPLLDVLDIKIRRQGELLQYGKDYEIDLDTLTVYFHNKSTYFTYRIVICVNADQINELLKSICNLK